MNVATLTPRLWDCKTKAEVIKAFNGDKDFTLQNFTDRYCGKACNKSDLVGGDYTHAKLRYSNNTKSLIIEI